MRTRPTGWVSNSMMVDTRAPFCHTSARESCDACLFACCIAHLDCVDFSVSARHHDAVVNVMQPCDAKVYRNPRQLHVCKNGVAWWIQHKHTAVFGSDDEAGEDSNTPLNQHAVTPPLPMPLAHLLTARSPSTFLFNVSMHVITVCCVRGVPRTLIHNQAMSAGLLVAVGHSDDINAYLST